MKQITTLAAAATVFVLSSFTIVHSLVPQQQQAYWEQAASKAESFKVDATHSKLTWLAKKVTGEHAGTINVSAGALTVENNVLKGGSFDLDTKSITVTDIEDKEANGKLLGHLKSDDFFAVEKFGTARFVITSAVTKGAGAYLIKGNLTIKGITNEVSFPASVTVSNNKLSANAKIVVDRTKYDIKFRSKSFFENLGDKTIADDFELNIQLVANK
ncbi:YceI family protein [Pedobacter sp. AW31-3R]|uniref:YceI family protein n=1 Tax=Pedobacter sp. AW31-3R TaxID=3445781 RepID=UPI003F9FB589